MDNKLGAMEMRFAELIWENAPINSGELVKLCEKELSWKKSTTYTMLRRLCQRGIFQNEDSIVSAVMSRAEFDAINEELFREAEKANKYANILGPILNNIGTHFNK